MQLTFVVLWGFFLVAAYFYARRAKHPRTQTLAAWLVFVIVFSVVAFSIFAGGTYALALTGRAALLADPLVAALFLVLVFIPAALLGRWQMRKPPRDSRSPSDRLML